MRKEKEMSSFDQTEKIKGKAVEKIARVAIAAGVGLTGCTPTLLRPNEPIETPSQGQALAIGLLNEQSINNLPDGEVKTSFVNELNDIKKDCAEIPGCLSDTIQIYRVNVNDPEEGTNVFSYHFANINDSEGLRTQILSVTDGKTQEKTEINEDLVAKDTVIEGIPTRVFGYVDDNGNSHYLLVDREVGGQNQFQIYDAEGTSYDVITQNAKEVQAYSSFWSAPGIVEAAPLPTNTPTAEVTPTEASTPTETATSTPGFTSLESIGDITKDLTPGEIEFLENSLQNSIGSWNENLKFDDRDGTTNITLASAGDIIDFQDSPLIVPVSDNENIKILEAVKAYYLNREGKARQVLVPLLTEMPDGILLNSCFDGQYVDKKNNDNLYKLMTDFLTEKEYALYAPGYLFNIAVLTSEHITEYFYDKAILHPDQIQSYPSLSMTVQIIKFNSFYKTNVISFYDTGDGLKIILPNYVLRHGIGETIAVP